MIEKIKNFLKNIIPWIKSHKRRTLIIVVVVIGIILFIRSRNGNGELELATAQFQDLTQVLEVTGEVNATEIVDLHFPATSRLSWVGVKEGDRVKQWQAIASVDIRTLQKQFQQDLNLFSKEFRDHDQTLDDYDFYGVPDLNRAVRRVIENAQFDLENAVLDVEIRNIAIRLSTLATPIDGIVTRVDEPIAGVNVAATDIFRIVNPDTLYFTAEIDEADIAIVKVGQAVTITLDAYPDEEIFSEITWLDFSASTSDSGGTIFRAKLSLPEIDTIAYRLGLNGEANIILNEIENVLAIPIDAVKTTDSKNEVEVLVNEKVETKEIEVGLETDDFVEVISGLEEGETVITGTK